MADTAVIGVQTLRASVDVLQVGTGAVRMLPTPKASASAGLSCRTPATLWSERLHLAFDEDARDADPFEDVIGQPQFLRRIDHLSSTIACAGLERRTAPG
jgi:hypothetical protein